ncbi:MAG: hypothetical protein ABIK62_05040, partial [candidate division WOR-3 bacterium]
SGSVLSPIDLSYSYTRSSNYAEAPGVPPLWYQLGLANRFSGDTLLANANRDVNTDFNASTSFRLKNLDGRIRYSRSWSRDLTGSTQSGSYTTGWPDLSVSLSSVERIAPRLWNSSSVSSGYSRQTVFAGNYQPGADTFDHFGRRLNSNINLSPLLSWQATWKNRMNTTASISHSYSDNSIYQDPERPTRSLGQNWNYSLNLSYSFSAPRGIRFPFLRKVKFSSDLDMNFGLTYATAYNSTIDASNRETPTSNTGDLNTNAAFSYRFSRSIEAGLRTGYRIHYDFLGRRSTRSVDIDFWVLFKF